MGWWLIGLALALAWGATWALARVPLDADEVALARAQQQLKHARKKRRQG